MKVNIPEFVREEQFEGGEYMLELQYLINDKRIPETQVPNWMSVLEVQKARNFHRSFPQYQETPLINLTNMSRYLKLKNVFIKDESYRFGLNAFKVLGGSYAIAKYVAEQLGEDMENVDYSFLKKNTANHRFEPTVFCTATDGNHGRGVAWAANQMGQRAIVYMPKGSTKQRFENIQKENAEVTIEDVNYDECVRRAAKKAASLSNGVVIQDTAWEGYEKIPKWIMEGYGTMALEAKEQIERSVGAAPTHIFVQAGVGSLAGAVQGFFADAYIENPPKIIVCEAREADCIYRSALTVDGSMAIVDGDMPTIMAGLACGEPNPLAWEILKKQVYAFLSCNDEVARRGMRMLAAPIKGDEAIISGESGAVTFGALATIMVENEYRELRERLGLDEYSRVLCFSTEGDTDPERYRRIVWLGENQ